MPASKARSDRLCPDGERGVMKTLIVDDGLRSSAALADAIANDDRFDLRAVTGSAQDALALARYERIEFAIVRVDCSSVSGYDLGMKLRESNNGMVLVLLTSDGIDVRAFLDVRADYLMLDPVDPGLLADVFDRAQILRSRQLKKVRIRTFGSFDVFVDGKPIDFRSAKAKELMALLVDRRGGYLTTEYAFALIWEGRRASDAGYSLCRKAFARLSAALESAGIGDILVVTPEGRYLDKAKFDCDLYDFLDGDPKARAGYYGEYMSSYTWGEVTHAALERIVRLS